MTLPRPPWLPQSRQHKLILLVGAVALPALLLAAFAIVLTLRVSHQIETESARYNAYLADKVGEAVERELIDRIATATTTAAETARGGGDSAAVVRDLARAARQFEAPHFVPERRLDGTSLLTVDGQLLVYGDDPSGRHAHPFAAVLLNGPDGVAMGAGGWWFNPRAFLATYLRTVVVDRLPSSPRMYGGYESTRHLCVQVFDQDGHEVARVREPGSPLTAREADLSGPFEGYRVRVTTTSTSPYAIASRAVTVQVALVVVLALVLIGAISVGLSYIARQVEVVQVKSSFVSNVTHELKTPIAVIKLAAETVEMGRIRTDAERDKYLRTIRRESDRLTQLVDNILDFSRLEAGQGMMRFAPADVHELVQGALDNFRLRLEDQGFRWEVALPERLPAVKADGLAIQHCLLNLLDNAVKYSRDRKEIRVSAAARDGMVGLSVADRGIGIEPEHHERIFEKFARVETGLVHTVKGAGLGLSLVDQIVRAHHGRIELASTPGEGSTFTLWLPVWDDGRGPSRA
ncbi:MAG TPA: HAMP domain-containing sensor histidine kinase [Candidatus Eisenbacteria bacterium]|nr:HAMP domain-containing sensor histidine kinase [Candidatus Eisenbacteria bacterium]